MRPLPPIALVLFILGLWLLTPAAHARGIIDKVTIKGLHRERDAEIIENIEASLSLYENLGRMQGEARLDYLLNQAERQAREALAPFGYYTPTITVDAQRSEDNHITVVLAVEKGEPVRVRSADIAITGPAERDRYLARDLADFRPGVGGVFDSTLYEASKIRIVRRLAERGYFDADFTKREVRVTRAEHAADVDLTWDSGARYDMGPVTFHQDYFRPGLLEQLVYWKEGSYFHQGKLDRLRESLNKLDYFANIGIETHPENAEDYRVPVDVHLTLAPRNIYTAGLSYGSESGPGVRMGLERRYVNRRGHKFNTELDYARRRKSFVAQYRVPAFRWLDGWYATSLAAYDEQTDYIDLRNLRLSLTRSGELDERWTAFASINALRERWSYDVRNGDRRYEYATLFYPELRTDYVDVDDRLFPRRGFSGSVRLRGGVEGVGSDATFGQVWSRLNLFLPIGDNDRLLLRGEAGTTWTGALVDMPPSLRFFAGGERSIRGYAWREVGPRTADDYALGAKHVLTGSVEYEHYLGGGPWGGAVFVDAGDAFDDRPDLHVGVGLGVRWRSPLGPVRVDVAHGLNRPDSPVQLYLSIGAEL